MAAPELADRFVSRLARAERLVRLWLEPRLLARGIRLPEFRMVGLLLGDKKGLTQKELADRLGVRAPTLSVAVAELEKKGVVERLAHPDDARAKRVRLRGRPAELPAIGRLLVELDAVALRGISAKDRAVALRVLARVAENLESARQEET